MEIKGIILDVDGVIVGTKKGYNFPLPNPKVISALKEIRSKGVFISLCSARPPFALTKVIKEANLDNFHITNGGGLVINPISNIIEKDNTISKELTANVLGTYLGNNLYIEVYTANDYYVQKKDVCSVTEVHKVSFQKAATVVDSLIEEAAKHKVNKFLLIPKNEKEKSKIIELFRPFEAKLELGWGIHPHSEFKQFGIITAKGISKKNAIENVIKKANVVFDNMLGVGDSTSDWQFIQQCKYGGAMGNATEELKKLVASKGDNQSCIGGPIDENGVLDIFRKFGLIEKATPKASSADNLKK